MNRIRTVGLAIALAFVVGGVAVTSASASEFKAAEYPVTVKAKATNLQGFEITGATTVCKKATFNTGEEGAGNPSLPSETLLVHPKYEECEMDLVGAMKTNAKTEGCNYRFHAAKSGSSTGSMDVVCAAGRQIELVDEGLEGCVISFGSQNGVKNVTYTNEAGKLKVAAELSGIKWKTTPGCGLATEAGENGKYREGEIRAGTAKLAPEGKPATAVFEGFNKALAADAIEVTPSPSAGPAHYYNGGLSEVARIPSGEKVPVLSWGTLSLTNLKTGGKVECHNIASAVLENPAPGGAEGPHGEGETQNFAAYECESAACTPEATKGGPATYVSVAAETMPEPFPEAGSATNLRWIGHLISEETTIRSGTEHIQVNVQCHVQTGVNAKGEPEFGLPTLEVSTGATKPKVVTKCCKAAAPPELEFDAGSGTLNHLAPKETQQVRIEGKLKTLGYKEEEVINAKHG